MKINSLVNMQISIILSGEKRKKFQKTKVQIYKEKGQNNNGYGFFLMWKALLGKNYIDIVIKFFIF